MREATDPELQQSIPEQYLQKSIVTLICFIRNVVELFLMMKHLQQNLLSKPFFPQQQLSTSWNCESEQLWSADKQRAEFFEEISIWPERQSHPKLRFELFNHFGNSNSGNDRVPRELLQFEVAL